MLLYKIPNDKDFGKLRFPSSPISPTGIHYGDNVTRLQPFHDTFPKDFNIFLEPHVHTKYSDGRLAVDQVMEWALAMGFNAIVLTDHNNARGVRQALELADKDPRFNNKLVVIPGMEYTSCRCHMNLINLDWPFDAAGRPLPANDTKESRESDRLKYYEFIRTMITERPEPTDQELKQLVKSVHAVGGLVSVNHIPWSTRSYPDRYSRIPATPNHPSRSQLFEWGVDFIEVVNGDTLDWVSVQFLQQPNVQGKMGMVTGSDFHTPVLPHAWTILKASLSRDAIVEQLRKRETSFLFDAGSLPLDLFPAEMDWYVENSRLYESFLPWIGLGSYVASFYNYRRSMISFQVYYRMDMAGCVDTHCVRGHLVPWTRLNSMA